MESLIEQWIGTTSPEILMSTEGRWSNSEFSCSSGENLATLLWNYFRYAWLNDWEKRFFLSGLARYVKAMWRNILGLICAIELSGLLTTQLITLWPDISGCLKRGRRTWRGLWLGWAWRMGAAMAVTKRWNMLRWELVNGNFLTGSFSTLKAINWWCSRVFPGEKECFCGSYGWCWR